MIVVVIRKLYVLRVLMQCWALGGYVCICVCACVFVCMCVCAFAPCSDSYLSSWAQFVSRGGVGFPDVSTKFSASVSRSGPYDSASVFLRAHHMI